MLNRLRGTFVASALALGAFGLAGQVDAATYSFGDGSYIDAYDGSNGLQIETEFFDLSGVSFDLDSFWESSDWFPLFKVWTNETDVDDSDKNDKDFDVYLDFDCLDELVHIDGETEGDKYWHNGDKYEYGKIKLDEWTFVQTDCISFKILLCMDDGKFNKDDWGLKPGPSYGEVVYAKLVHLDGDFCCRTNVVPTPSAAGAGLLMAGLGLLRRRRRAA